MPSTFLGITTGSNLYLTNQLHINMVLWMDEAFLNAGMYRRIPGSGDADYAGNLLCQMQPVSDARYPSGSYWEARTNNWVYESGLSIQAGFTTPFRPSGVYVKQPSSGEFLFLPSGNNNGNYNYTIDYKRGAIKFTNNYIVDPGATVLCPHSYKEIHVDIADNVDFNQLMYSDTKNEDLGSGLGFPTDGQIQFPAVFIESIGRRWEPFELGGNKIAIDALRFHVFATTRADRDQICDMLDGMKSRNVKLVNFNTAPLPLDDNGDINPAYPNLDTLQLTNYWKTSYFEDVESERFRSNAGYYRAEITARLRTYTFN
jgi:hypothetical protein